jgi:hypothetical protein
MTTTFLSRDDLGQLEARLYRQLLLMSLLSAVLGTVLRDWTWGVAAALGPLSAQLYYWALAQHTRRVVRARVLPLRGLAVASVAFRQILSLLAPASCFYFWGSAGWVCLATLLLSRHWVVAVAWPVQPNSLRSEAG